jgi:ribonucleotide reductase alpha subunit
MKRKADGQLDLIALESSQAASPAVPSAAKPSAPVFVLKRDKTTEPFDEKRITLALESAFKAVREIPADEPMTGELMRAVSWLTEKISRRLLDDVTQGKQLDVEYIQDAVENQLMCDGYLTEARRFILYREDRRKIREQAAAQKVEQPAPVQPIEPVQPEQPPQPEVAEKLGAHLLLKVIYSEVIPESTSANDFAALHQKHFSYAIQDAVHHNQLAPELLLFDLEHLSNALKLERDELIARDGLEWLYGNCLARDHDRCVETPQYFWMRIAMALAATEGEATEDRALEFYEALSTLRLIPSEHLLRTSGRSAAFIARAQDVDEPETTARVVAHINLAGHVQDGMLDELLLYGTVATGVRFLDNAIDATKYRSDLRAQHAREHRAIALGIVGYNQALATDELAQSSTEAVAYYATLASASLASERGCYDSESNWSAGVLPFEALKLSPTGPTANCSKDWLAVRAAIRRYGLRNSHLLALTPANVVEQLIGKPESQRVFSEELNRLVKCRKWIDGPVYITLPQYLADTDLDQACLLAQQLGIRSYIPPLRVTLADDRLVDTAVATKVLKGIETKGS